MYRLIIFIFVISFIYSCSPKLATSDTQKDYSEDLSMYRPKVEKIVDNTANSDNKAFDKGPYSPPTHDINKEMSLIMDSIVVHNRENTFLTYTVQVYTGRSREQANQVREKVYRVLPEEKPALIYKQPSYKVTVGRFFDRVEAYKTFNELRKAFPAAILVPERNYLEEYSPY